MSLQNDARLYLQDILTFSNDPLAQFNNPTTEYKKTNRYALHRAAQHGNTKEILRLLEEGYDVNQEDSRSIRPLHVAAYFGQNEAAKLLLQYGALVDDKGYEGHTALHFAAKKNHLPVVETLIFEGYADPKLTTYDGKNAYTFILDNLETKMDELIDTPSTKAIHQFNKMLSMLELLVSQDEGPYLYSSSEEIDSEYYVLPFPLSGHLKLLAAASPNKTLSKKLNNLSEDIQSTDNTGDIFYSAKDLLHHFPTGELYQLNIDQDKKIWMTSEGHFGLFTTALARDSIEAYINTFDFQESDSLKLESFLSLKKSYDFANDFIGNANLIETAKKAWKMYLDGQTVLLPSGWEGHFVDVIISKTQNLYAIANSGQRYHGEAPDFDGDSAGILFYHLNEPEALNVNFFYSILTNEDQLFLEYETIYQYSLIEKIDEIPKPTQVFGNCGWESHRDAIEGIMYIELLNHGIESNDAKSLAQSYYEDWDYFHGDYVIDRYMENSPGLPLQALLDIFKEIHKKENFSHRDKHHAQKIVEALSSPVYFEEFNEWLTTPEDDLANTLMKNMIQQQYEVNIPPLLMPHDENTVIWA